MVSPSAAAAMQTTIIPVLLNSAINLSPRRASFTESNDAVEKVVNPPQNPVPSIASQCGDSTPWLAPPAQMPSKKEPRVFTTHVPRGKREWELDKISSRRKRQAAPRPAASARKAITACLQCECQPSNQPRPRVRQALQSWPHRQMPLPGRWPR